MKLKVLFISISLILTALISSCEKADDPTNPIVLIGEVGEAGWISQQLGWDLFREVIKDHPGENVIISPLSVQIALTMALNGADAKTKAEMLALLHCPDCSAEKLNKDLAELQDWLQNKSGHPTFNINNSIFYDQNRVMLHDEYLEKLTGSYALQKEVLNFSDPSAKDKINNRVKQQTQGRIDKIVEEIKPLDLAFLINVLYFKSDWAKGFDERMTRDLDFRLSDGSSISVPFVMGDRDFLTARTDELEMVDLPFRDSTFSLSLIRHRNPDPSVNAWAQEIDSDKLSELYSLLKEDRALVHFPRFSMSFDVKLPDVLKRLGMIDAFSEVDANFEPMGRSLIGDGIFISQVNHAATLEVDEKGAEGAAVTSVGFSTTSLPPSFTFDSPFVLNLRHIPTNTVIFAGLVEDPSED